MTARMRRRDFITLLGGAAVAGPLSARAQQPDRVRRIGVLMLYPENDSEGQLRATAFRQGLQKLGWTVGRNVEIDFQWGFLAAAAFLTRPVIQNLGGWSDVSDDYPQYP